MTVSPIYTVHCDGCADWVAQTATRQYARRIAKAAGWVRRRRGGALVDLCPTCALVPCVFGRFGECDLHKSNRSQADPTKCLALIDAIKESGGS